MAKYNAKGSIFKWTISASLTTVAQVRSIETDEGVDLVDATDLSDTYRTFVPGIIQPGTISLELVFDPAGTGYTNMRTDMLAHTERAAQITYSSSTKTEDFSVRLTSLRKVVNEGGALVATFVGQVTTLRTLN